MNWLQNHLIPCPFKHLTGIDCPGCGFQRSVIELIQGNLYKSVGLYPPAIPLLLFLLYLIFGKYIKVGNPQVSKRYFFIAIAAIIMVNYCFKIWSLYAHYTASPTAAIWL
ncbi:MAG: DUF2752 domain-containing protein [Mucilaginibacter sp.]